MPAPPVVRAAAVSAIGDGKSTYSYAEGIQPLRQAMADKLLRHNGIRADPKSEIVVTVGATGAFVSTINALLNKGDGILVLEPYYPYHVLAATVAGFEPQYLTLQGPDFALRYEELAAAIQPNTRAIVVCTPCNPSGKMFDSSDLDALAKVASEYDLLVITDEVYEFIRFEGAEHISPASREDLRDRTVTIMGLSKTFSITGWRLGYAVAPEHMARAITQVHDLFYICAATPLQHGVVEGFRLDAEFYASMQRDYQRKRDIICEALVTANFEPLVPKGAYYVLADLGRLGYPTARDAAMALLEECGVASVPGVEFFRGDEGQRYVRFCFAAAETLIQDAAKRIRKFGNGHG